MDADANGTVAAVTDDGKLYFIRQGKIMDIVEPSEGADFPAVSLMKTDFVCRNFTE